MSHPTWVRGLKPKFWNHSGIRIRVAPYMGAWIETEIVCSQIRRLWSHPTWVRGLKPRLYVVKFVGFGVAPYMGAWIET